MATSHGTVNYSKKTILLAVGVGWKEKELHGVIYFIYLFNIIDIAQQDILGPPSKVFCF